MKNVNWCTLFPDGKWAKCCKEHDADYASKSISREEADIKLYNCVKRHAGFTIAFIMKTGVRFFGWIWWK